MALNREFERLQYWQGQTLRSRDFRDQSALDAQRRALHNRALHGAQGVSPTRLAPPAITPDVVRFGLGVAVKSPGLFTVDCGIGYDCFGRELILQRPREIAGPGTTSLLVLRRRRQAQESNCCPTSDPGCIPEGARDLDDGFELVWQAEDAFDPRTGAALARVLVDAAGARIDNTYQRRLARPLARSRLARGETVRGNTPWELWAVDEPDGKGGLTKRVAGVQTFVDTSAAGFTETPNYFATLASNRWDVLNSEFAPAFFPHVADPTVDGFLFRLLMVETTRRRYRALADTTRVSLVERQAGDILKVTVASASAFSVNDAVALLRPRGDAAHFIQDKSGTTLTLDSALPATAQANETILALGNAPRISRVTPVQSPDQVTDATFISDLSIKKNDILARFTDNALATISSVSTKRSTVTVEQPFVNWKKDDPIGVAQLSTAAAVESVELTADGGKAVIKLKEADASIVAGNSVVLLNDAKKPAAPAAIKVKSADGAALEVTPPLDTATAKQVKFAVLARKEIDITDVRPRTPGMTVKANNPDRFREGDFVAAADNLSVITTVDNVDTASGEVNLRDVIDVSKSSTLVAAEWAGATAIDQVTAGDPTKLVVGRAGAVLTPCFIVTVGTDGSFGTPIPVRESLGTTVTLTSGLAGGSHGDVLAIGVFPRFATVAGQQGDSIRVTPPGVLRSGDVLIRVANAAQPAPLAAVTSASGDTLQVSPSLGTLALGEQLATVQFRDTTLLTAIGAGRKIITVDRDVPARENDFVAVLTHYRDNSGFGFIENIQDNVLTLQPPAIGTGDGIVRADLIDGGILGFAAVTYPAQPTVRLESSQGLEGAVQQAIAVGFDTTAGLVRSVPVLVFTASSLTGQASTGNTNRVFLFPLDGSRPAFRPETLSLITTFNTDFPRAFAIFAQKQELSVCWIGCQQEKPFPGACPGTTPAEEVCAGCNSQG